MARKAARRKKLAAMRRVRGSVACPVQALRAWLTTSGITDAQDDHNPQRYAARQRRLAAQIR
jgi:hypothetical protein